MALSDAWLPRHAIGGSNGNPFEIFSGSNGGFFKIITVQANENKLIGIAVTWTDGTHSAQICNARGSPAPITLTEGETITNA